MNWIPDVSKHLSSSTGFEVRSYEPYINMGGMNTTNKLLPSVSSQSYKGVTSYGDSLSFGSPMSGYKPTNELSTRAGMQITCAALTDESQLTISYGDALFSYNPGKEAKDESIVMNLPTLNYYLEEAFVTRSAVNSNMKESESVKRKVRGLDMYSFPCTLQEFEESITFLGIMIGSNSPKGVRAKEIVVGIDGLISDIPNWMGSVELGDSVDLYVKYYQNKSTTRIRYDGQTIGRAIPGQYLQVKPYINHETRFPIVKQNKYEYSEKDASYLEPTVVRMDVVGDNLKYPGSGLRDLLGAPKVSNLPVLLELPKEALVYHLGTVTKYKKIPTDYDVSLALRSAPHISKIASEGCLISLTTNTFLSQLTNSLRDDKMLRKRN